MIFSQSGGSDGIGFAIPADIALGVVDQIVRQGRVIRGWLGVGLQPHQTVDGRVVLRVVRVARGGPAHRAGLKLGDYVLSVNQMPATSTANIITVIAGTQPGDVIDVEVMRRDQRFHARAIAGELPDPA